MAQPSAVNYRGLQGLVNIHCKGRHGTFMGGRVDRASPLQRSQYLIVCECKDCAELPVLPRSERGRVFTCNEFYHHCGGDTKESWRSGVFVVSDLSTARISLGGWLHSKARELCYLTDTLKIGNSIRLWDQNQGSWIDGTIVATKTVRAETEASVQLYHIIRFQNGRQERVILSAERFKVGAGESGEGPSRGFRLATDYKTPPHRDALHLGDAIGSSGLPQVRRDAERSASLGPKLGYAGVSERRVVETLRVRQTTERDVGYEIKIENNDEGREETREINGEEESDSGSDNTSSTSSTSESDDKTTIQHRQKWRLNAIQVGQRAFGLQPQLASPVPSPAATPRPASRHAIANEADYATPAFSFQKLECPGAPRYPRSNLTNRPRTLPTNHPSETVVVPHRSRAARQAHLSRFAPTHSESPTQLAGGHPHPQTGTLSPQAALLSSQRAAGNGGDGIAVDSERRQTAPPEGNQQRSNVDPHPADRNAQRGGTSNQEQRPSTATRERGTGRPTTEEATAKNGVIRLRWPDFSSLNTSWKRPSNDDEALSGSGNGNKKRIKLVGVNAQPALPVAAEAPGPTSAPTLALAGPTSGIAAAEMPTPSAAAAPPAAVRGSPCGVSGRVERLKQRMTSLGARDASFKGEFRRVRRENESLRQQLRSAQESAASARSAEQQARALAADRERAAIKAQQEVAEFMRLLADLEKSMDQVERPLETPQSSQHTAEQ